CLFSSLAVAGAPIRLQPPTSGLGGTGDFFGIAMHSDADWLMVGAYGDLLNSEQFFTGIKSGTVQVFSRSVGLIASQTLQPPEPTPSTLFGDEIQRRGNRLAISAPRFSSGSGGQEGGGVFLFTLIDNQW